MKFSLGIVVLNWNRHELLDRCLSSLLETTDDFTQCIVIDNNSSDLSQDVVRKHAGRSSKIVPMLKHENRGAEWINDALDLTDDDLIFVLANDKVLLPGWRKYVDDAFAAFPQLGQLALHAPAPLDDEVWATKSAEYAYSKGVGLYRASENTGMSSVIRRSIIDAGNVRFRNIPGDGPVKLPADALLSAELKAMGCISAWSDRYYSLNVGHTLAEFEKNRDYYESNYEAKDWLKIEGMRRRIAEHKESPKPKRDSRIFGWLGAPENISGSENPSVRTWSTFGDGSLDLESLDLLYAVCRLAKPQRVAIVRGWTGRVAIAAGMAMRDNGFGNVLCCEPDPFMVARTAALIADYDLADKIAIEPSIHAHCDLAVLCGYLNDEAGIDDWTIDKAIAETELLLFDPSHMSERWVTSIERRIDQIGFDCIDFTTPRHISLLKRKG